jgi:membrane associated rhomboid family serine protease
MLHDRDYMRESGRHAWSETLWPDAVTLIIIANAVVFVAQHFFGIAADHLPGGKVHPWGELSIAALTEGRVWTVFTHMFVHADILHVAGNCFTLFFVGKSVQSLLGARPFLYIYFISGLVGAALELGLQPFLKMPMVGASACIAGVFMALAVLLPQEEITFIYFIIPVRVRLWTLAKIFLGVTVILGILQLVTPWNTGVAHFAHFGGALAGWYMVRYMGYGGPGFTYDQLWTERPPPAEQSHEYAGVKARRRVVDLDESEWSPTSMSAKEFIEKEINPILEKISAHGLGSLTVEEKKLLERARTEIMNRDKRH